MTDAQLDSYLDAYLVPELDEKAFDDRLMREISAGKSSGTTGKTVFLWQRSFQALMAVVVAVFAVALFMQSEQGTLPKSDAGEAVIAGISEAEQPSGAESEDVVLASFAGSGNNGLSDDFLNEMADQEILFTEYMPEEQATPPMIDEFLDELLGAGSR